ncbi:transcriptional regulator [Pontibacillus yanchengensis]|uniref:Transcriptional regulator n=1 Tax=Pontibacillus yanchengensis TaxID=462910 RepID=A0A6I5A2G7_9BACI|nr:BTAD domain-containing putative transcriptional regulator [Pontibacillus yanchengensis]MYL35050.1 transcriptional regulator [Pontibacillus yanchengensis]
MERIPIIHTQLNPPTIKDRFVRRVKLQRKLKTVIRYPLVVMHSGAGYGKSTALTLFVQDSEIDVSWFSISQNDDDLVPFLTKLVHAVRIQYPNFGETLLHELEEIYEYVQDQHIWSLVSMMVNELSRVEGDLYVILDDFHHVEHSLSIEQWMIHFIEHLPSNCHLILSSRNKPQWTILNSLKVKGHLLEITQEDLLLSQEEMEHLLLDLYDMELTNEMILNVHRVTEGWAIAFEMVIQQLQSGLNLEPILENDPNSLQDLFDYLAHEVLSKQSFMVQQFLEQTSVLEILSPKLCDYVLGMTGSEAMLDQLADQHIFLQEVSVKHYRYHQLFKSFLENRMKEKRPDEYRQLHRKAARYQEQNGDMETAILHLERVEDYDRMSQLVSQYGGDMLKHGKLQSLYEHLLVLPTERKRHYPILWFYQGEILRYWSSYMEAEQCYKRSEELGRDRYDHYLYSIALEGQARIYLDTIQPDQAERILQHAIDLRAQTEASKEEMGRLYYMLAENLLNAGNATKAESWLEKARELNLPLEDGNLEARLYLRTGRLEKAEKVLLERKERQPFNESHHLPQSHRETDILLSIISAFMGKSEASKAYAESGIHQGIQIQSPFVEACGWMRIGHAVQLMNRYDAQLAERCYQTSLEMMEKLNVSRGKAEPYMGLCILYGSQYEYEKALEAGQKGLHETENVKDLWLSSLIQLCMAIASIYCAKWEEAQAKLEKVEGQFKDCGDAYGLMLVSFWRAYSGYHTEQDDLFEKEIRTFLQLIQTTGYEFFFHERTTFGPIDLQNCVPLLFKAQEMKIHEHYVSKVIYDLGYGSMDHHPGYTLRVQTLGQLTITLGNQVVEEKDWQRGKAKELFELLVTKRHTQLQKEEIYQHLWPDQEEEGANRSFKVALNALLKTVEPHRKARAESFFIKKDGNAYGLNPKSGYELDSAIFEEWVAAGLEENDAYRAKALLEKGLALYKGDFLPDQRFADWCLNERERLQVLFLRGAEKLAQVSVRLQDFDTCIYWGESILRMDQTWEEAYRLLMYSYYQKNNRPQAIKWYKKCCDVLDRELGVEPMNPTREMYDIVMSAKDTESYV